MLIICRGLICIPNYDNRADTFFSDGCDSRTQREEKKKIYAATSCGPTRMCYMYSAVCVRCEKYPVYITYDISRVHVEMRFSRLEIPIHLLPGLSKETGKGKKITCIFVRDGINSAKRERRHDVSRHDRKSRKKKKRKDSRS